jgi:ribose-phosphate pyrophosphokinase
MKYRSENLEKLKELSDEISAYENVEKSSLVELIVTDTIPLKKNIDKITVLSVSTLLSRTIRNIVEYKSLSKLFI